MPLAATSALPQGNENVVDERARRNKASERKERWGGIKRRGERGTRNKSPKERKGDEDGGDERGRERATRNRCFLTSYTSVLRFVKNENGAKELMPFCLFEVEWQSNVQSR